MLHQSNQRQGHIESLESRIYLAADFAAADFNTDQRLDAKDIDVLISAVVDQDPEDRFDLNDDQKLDESDVDYLVSNLLGTTRGDVDLDGDVDFRDFLSLANGFGQPGGWSDGNFDLQLSVSFDDFLALATSFGFRKSTASYTHHNLDGNRYVEGWGELPAATPVDIPLSFVPEWVLGSQLEDRQLWVAVAVSGETQAFELNGTSFTEVEIEPNILPPGAPPALVVSDETYSFIAPTSEASTTTHPIRLGKDLSKTAYIRNDGHVVVVKEDGVHESADVNAMLDARLLSDGEGRLLVLTEPTTAVPHGVLGDTMEASSVTLVDTNSTPWAISKIEIPDGKVIEGLSPIWVNTDDKPEREIIVTLSSRTNGGQITVFAENGEIVAQEPGIGRGSRWRHQLAVAPFGTDRALEFVDVLTPHIGGVVEFRTLSDSLTIVGDVFGNTSHVIGSRNLDMAVAADFDADGIVELLLPNQQRTNLTGVSRTSSGGIVDWQVSLDGVLNTNIAVSRSHDGRLSVGVGRRDAVLRVFV